MPDLRHTCSSLLAAVNTPRIEIEAQMGHRADTSERIYQHLIEELCGTELGLDELIAKARKEVFDDEDVRSAFGGKAGSLLAHLFVLLCRPMGAAGFEPATSRV